MSTSRKRRSSALRTLYLTNNPLPYFRDWLDKNYPPRLYHPHYAKFFAARKVEYIRLILQREIKALNTSQKKFAKDRGLEYEPYVQELIYAVSRMGPQKKSVHDDMLPTGITAYIRSLPQDKVKSLNHIH